MQASQWDARIPAKTKYRFAKSSGTCLSNESVDKIDIKKQRSTNPTNFCHPANETSQRIIMALDLIKHNR